MKQNKSYGSWPSKITPEMVVAGSPKYHEPSLCGNHIYWLQTLPNEKGRTTIMRYDGRQIHSILPRPLSAKSKVHEYGGGSYAIDRDSVYFVLADDQRVYRAALTNTENSAPSLAGFDPHPLSPEPDQQNQYRFADLCIDQTHQRIIAVCEQHSDQREPVNFIAAMNMRQPSKLQTLVSGNDFYSNPRISPDGKWLSWLSWNHPDMPWDATQLWIAEIKSDGFLGPAILIAGETKQSIFQPQWSPEGMLYFVSDIDNWWNIYRYKFDKRNTIEQITRLQGEFATPQWTFNMSTYGFLNAQTLLATYYQNGKWTLCEIHLQKSHQEIVNISATDHLSVIFGLAASTNNGVFVGSSPQNLPAVFHLSKLTSGESVVTPLNPSPLPVDPNELSEPELIQFDSTDSGIAYGYYYPPRNTRFDNEDAAPPLIVICHGGPTGATDTGLNFKMQFWTNRGFAVLDINYRGSTGYGREYRQQLYGKWGVYDVDDICAGALYAVNRGWAMPQQLIVKGSSAGGYTVLAALTFRDVFQAGVSLYGIGDLKTLVADTHKFEARYLDTLIGDSDPNSDRYYQRSPIHFTEQLDCPILIFQGLEDKVVPPNQAICMAEAVKSKGLQVAYVEYHDEGHGFRNAETLCHMLNAEYFFYCKIFGFEVPAELDSFIPIINS